MDNDIRFNRIQMKRDFVTANRARDCKSLQPADFKDCLDSKKKEVSELSERQLNKEIIDRDRLKRFNSHNWHLKACRLDEMGVWPRMGDGLPLEWCEGSVQETAAHVNKFLQEQNPIYKTPGMLKSVRKIQEMLPFADILKEIPIVMFPGGLHKRERRTKWDIDDGCFRAVALALKGKEKAKAWVGSPRC